MDNLGREGQRRGDETVGTFHLGLKAGDVVFWHSLLAHSGSPRINPALSRKSVMFHYIVRITNLYTCEQFMLHDPADLAASPPHPRRIRRIYTALMGVAYMRYPHFVTYQGGEAIVHTLKEGLRRRLRWALGRRR